MLFQKSIDISDNYFIVKNKDQILRVEGWGDNSVRVISSPLHHFDIKNKNGIEELNRNGTGNSSIVIEEKLVVLTNKNLKVIYDGNKLVFYNQNIKILEEFSRKQSNVRRTIGVDDYIPIEDESSSSLNISPREFIYKSENNYKAILRFEGNSEEKIFGLGGYQEANLNKNFGSYELMQRNSQTSIPFYISNKNYGFIWNSSAIGEVNFSKNEKVWISNKTESIDYIITVGENPKALLENFTTMTGKPPMIDDNLLGLWQSKLRYQTLNEIEQVYTKYNERNILLSVLVIDYFHWTADGDFEFDMKYWEGIDVFSRKIKEKGTKLMVSLWPTVSKESKYFNYYKNNQLVIQSVNQKNNMFGEKEIIDFSNPMSKEHVRKKLNENYRELGIDLYWADQAEPEMDFYNHNEYLIYPGNLEKYGNKYPYYYLETIQNDKFKNYKKGYPALIRSAWFNSQKYGALAWSGDIESSFESLKKQIQIGISMGISGIPWWTSDIAGFHSGDSTKDTFKELMVRWFQFAVFTPILRMHGDRQPHTPKIGLDGGGVRTSGGPNEIWSFGIKVENILSKFIKIRKNLEDYIIDVYKESTEYGYPIMRSLFFEFPNDEKTWNDTTNYMFGSELLIVPVVEEGTKDISVYLPTGYNWIEVFTGKKYDGGKTYKIETSIEYIPVFCKSGMSLENKIEDIFNL